MLPQKLESFIFKKAIYAKSVEDFEKLPVFGVSNKLGITVTNHKRSENLDNYLLIESGDFAYNPYRINVGSIGLVPAGMKGLVSPAYVVFSTTDSLSPELLLDFLKSTEGLQEIARYARGTVRKSLRFEDLAQIRISVPSKKRQSEILAIRESIRLDVDLVKSELTLQQDLLKKLRQQILQEAIEGKLTVEWRKQNPVTEPASHLLERIAAEKAQLVKEKKIKAQRKLPPITEAEKPFDLPEGWELASFGQVTINKDEFRIPVTKADRSLRDKIYDYYGASGIIDKIDGYTHEGKHLLISEDGANLVARATPVAFIANGKFWVNNHAHVVTTVNDITMDYLKVHINAIDLKPYLSGGFQPKLSQINLNTIKINLPPLAEQKAIVAKVEKLMTLCDKLEEQITQNQTHAGLLLQSVLQEAFSGAGEG
jgi:restriction endonuclease S subunit